MCGQSISSATAFGPENTLPTSVVSAYRANKSSIVALQAAPCAAYLINLAAAANNGSISLDLHADI
jgi:hypothetical protein